MTEKMAPETIMFGVRCSVFGVRIRIGDSGNECFLIRSPLLIYDVNGDRYDHEE